MDPEKFQLGLEQHPERTGKESLKSQWTLLAKSILVTGSPGLEQEVYKHLHGKWMDELAHGHDIAKQSVHFMKLDLWLTQRDSVCPHGLEQAPGYWTAGPA